MSDVKDTIILKQFATKTSSCKFWADMRRFLWHTHNNMPELEVVDEDYGQLEMLQQEQQDTYPLTCPASMITMQSVSGIDNIGNPDNSLCIAKNL